MYKSYSLSIDFDVKLIRSYLSLLSIKINFVKYLSQTFFIKIYIWNVKRLFCFDSFFGQYIFGYLCIGYLN